MATPNPPDPPPDPPPPTRWQRFKKLGLRAVPVLIVPLAIAWLTPFPGWVHDGFVALTAAPRPTAPSNCVDGLCVITDWPTFRGCDGVTAVAMQAGGRPLTTFASGPNLRSQIASAKAGGTWREGQLYLDFIGVDDTPIQIVNLRPAMKKSSSPAWVYAPQGGCGELYERAFKLDLDRPSLTDLGVQGNPDAQHGAPPRTEPLGRAFVVTKQDPALVRVDAVSCRGNYEWTLDIMFDRAGQRYGRTVGPYRSMGVASDTTFYTDEVGAGFRSYETKSGPAEGAPC